jgi:hypothetical protein
MWDRATTPNGVLGSKMMWNDCDWLRSERHAPAGTDAGLSFMRTAFPDPQFVWLRRADKVRQGISWWRAVDQDHLPPVRYRQQAGRLTKIYVDLVRSAINSPCAHLSCPFAPAAHMMDARAGDIVAFIPARGM